MSDKEEPVAGFDDFGDEPIPNQFSKPVKLPKAGTAKPMPFMSWDNPKVNPMWIAEYMRQHNLSLEVVLEHWAVYMRRFLEQLTETVELIEGSDAKTVNAVKIFVKDCKPLDGFYGEIPLVKVFKEETKCSVPLKKQLPIGSKNSSKT